MRSPLLQLTLLTLVPGCAATATQMVRLDEMSAEDHRREAAIERALSDDRLARTDPSANAASPRFLAGTDVSLYPIQIYPFGTSDWHLRASERRARHARAHEQAAAQLESFEEQECRGVPSQERAACPMLGRLTDVEHLAGGARLTLADPTRVDGVVTQMRCHLAFARARGYPADKSCPLYLRGMEIRKAPDGAIELRSADDEGVAEIHRAVDALR